MSLTLQAIWILAALGSAVFAARSTGFSLCLFVLGFAAPVGLGYTPVPEHIGTLAVAAAGISLFLPRWQVLASFFGGLVAGTLAPLIVSTGLPLAAAVAISAVLPCVTLWLARNPNFAPSVVMEEALLLLLLLGLGTAVVPPIFEGWQTARGMNGIVGDASRSMPAWVLLAGGASIVLGSAWSVWRSRST